MLNNRKGAVSILRGMCGPNLFTDLITIRWYCALLEQTALQTFCALLHKKKHTD